MEQESTLADNARGEDIRNHTGSGELVLKAHVKSCVGVGSERHSRLAGNVLWPAVFIAHGVLDLDRTGCC